MHGLPTLELPGAGTLPPLFRRRRWNGALQAARGTLYTFTIMHQVMNPGFASSVPYNVAQIDLDEGVRMVSNVVGIGNDALRIGMKLEAVFEDVERRRPPAEIPPRRRLSRRTSHAEPSQGRYRRPGRHPDG